jgi:hypothetical protein
LRRSGKATLGQLFFRVGQLGGMASVVYGAVRLSDKIAGGHTLDPGALVVDAALFFIGGFLIYLIGWFLRLSLTGEHYLI